MGRPLIRYYRPSPLCQEPCSTCMGPMQPYSGFTICRCNKRGQPRHRSNKSTVRVCMQCGHRRLGMWCLSPSRRPVDKDADGISHEKCQPAGHSDGMIGSSATSPRMSLPESGISPVERQDVSSQPFCRHKTVLSTRGHGGPASVKPLRQGHFCLLLR